MKLWPFFVYVCRVSCFLRSWVGWILVYIHFTLQCKRYNVITRYKFIFTLMSSLKINCEWATFSHWINTFQIAGDLVVVLLASKMQFYNHSMVFLRSLSILLNSHVTIKQKDGFDLVTEVIGNDVLERRRRSHGDSHSRMRRASKEEPK